MVLGYGGFFGLSSTEYEAKLRSAKTEDLKKQEIVKTRAQVAAALSLFSGFAFAHTTLGGSLIVSLAGGRKWRVADRKLEMIRGELSRRGVPLHKFDWRDIVISIGACAVGLGVDYGVGNLINLGDTILPTSGSSGAGHALPTSHIPYSQQFHEMIIDPVDALHGVEQGAGAQPELLLHHGTLSIAHILGTSSSDTPVQIVPLNPPALNAPIAEQVGAQLGVEGTHSVEQNAGEIIFQQLSWRLAESIEHHEWSRQAARLLRSSHYGGASKLYCEGC